METPKHLVDQRGPGPRLTGKYKRTGDYVHAQITLTVGSTTNVGSMLFTLPHTAVGGFAAHGIARDSDLGNYYQLGGRISGASVLVGPLGTNGLIGTFGSTNPFTWAVGDNVNVDVRYRV